MSNRRGVASAAEALASPWIVRGEVLEALEQADEIRAAASATAKALRACAVSEAEAIRLAARQEGLRQGAAAAATLLADAANAADTFQKARERELVPLAFAIAHRILGVFPEDDRMRRAVTTALEEYAGTSGLRLRADPDTAALLRGSLGVAARPETVVFEVDDQAPSGRCTLLHSRGQVAIGPADQLRTLFQAIPGAMP